jgi:integrase
MVGLSFKPEEGVMESVLLDAAGRRRSPATMPGFGSGRPPRNKGLRYPPDPPGVEEIVAVMRTVGGRGEGVRLRAFIVILWRAGLRISEALALAESDLNIRARHTSAPAALRATSLRAHRVANPSANPLPTQSMTRSLAKPPYHPHIQHADLGVTSVYARDR